MGGRFGPKHQKKVDECYPQDGNGESGAVSGKLSALTYYINAKPSKLLKVCAYLEKKVPKDFVRESSAYNAVTIEIIQGIMHNCSEYFGAFAPTALKLILLFSDSPLNESLTSKLHCLFVEFCRMTKGVLPSIRDSEFFRLLTKCLDVMVQGKFSNRIENYELIAQDVSVAVSMEDFLAPQGADRISIIIKTIIRILRTQDNVQLGVEELFGNSKRNTTNGGEISSMGGEGGGGGGSVIGHQPFFNILGHSFVSLVEGINSTTVPIVLNCIFMEFGADNNWTHQRLCAGLLNILVRVIPAQYLCVVLSDFFKRLEDTEDNVTVILADTMAELLRSNRSPLGYSGLELARNLLKLLRKQRPATDTETRASIMISKVRPPRAIYSICNAFVALLRNANFALQKYEIIEAIISRAFFRDSKWVEATTATTANELVKESLSLAQQRQLNIPTELIERHSIGTVTLDTIEEGHFKSVVWGILFALAEEGSSPNVLRLAFVEIHVKLFEILFRMTKVVDEDFVLNALIFWRQLLIHGLPIAPSRRSAESQTTVAKSIVLGRPSLYIFGKTRLILAYLATTRELNLTIIHITAIFSLIRSLLSQCDIQQLIKYTEMSIWLTHKFARIEALTFEDRCCMILFSLYTLRDIANSLSKLQGTNEANDESSLKNLIAKYIETIQSKGMRLIEMEDILDNSINSMALIDECPDDIKQPEQLFPDDEQIFLALKASLRDFEGMIKEYSVEEDEAFTMGQQKGLAEKNSSLASFSRSGGGGGGGRRREENGGIDSAGGTASRNTMGTFSRLSKLGSTAASAITAPAFYQIQEGSSIGGLNRPARTLTVSSSSLANSDTRSVSMALTTDPLDAQFDQLSLRMKEKKHRDQTKSMLFFKKG